MIDVPAEKLNVARLPTPNHYGEPMARNTFPSKRKHVRRAADEKSRRPYSDNLRAPGLPADMSSQFPKSMPKNLGVNNAGRKEFSSDPLSRPKTQKHSKDTVPFGYPPQRHAGIDPKSYGGINNNRKRKKAIQPVNGNK